MPIRQLTADPTEGDLEAEIHRAMKVAFAWLPPQALAHQTKFSFKFGHAKVEVDGASVSRAESRADILVYFNAQPVAVFELKRGGLTPTSDDVEQGLSYARMLHPRPPLVVVTNGREVQFFETHTGNTWQPSEPSEALLAQLIDAASRAASVDIKRAVEVLLGPGSRIWMQAIRGATDLILNDLTGDWDEPHLSPFVRDFYIPRKASAVALYLLGLPKRILILEGPPLSGKSSVLRELCFRTSDSDEFATLFVEADGGAGQGVFQQLANILTAKLAWPVTPDEVRKWLQRLSRVSGPSLVLALDGVGTDRDEVRRDLEELSSNAYGQNLKIVIGVDDTLVDGLINSPTGRKANSLGRQASRVEISPLDDDEFALAQHVLLNRRYGFTHGANAAPEFRVPWVLRALVSVAASDPRHQSENLVAVLPPLLGLGLIDHARERFRGVELRRKFQEAAKCVFRDSIDRSRAIGLVLESLVTFVVRRKTVEAALDRTDIDSLIKGGFFKPGLHESGEAILVVQLPELLASELAAVVAAELEQLAANDVKTAAEWLSQTAALIPLGDIVAAQALYDAAARGSVSLDLITALLRERPREEPIAPGTRAATYLPGEGVVDVFFQGAGSFVIEGRRRREVVNGAGDDPPSMLTDAQSWLILSYFAARPFIAQRPDGTSRGRIDPEILLELGTCPIILRRPGGNPEMNTFPTHSIPGQGEIVCHRAGIIEPITMAIYSYLGSEGPVAADWIESAIAKNSFPLMARVEIALRQLLSIDDQEISSWASATMQEKVKPAFERFPSMHDDSEG